MPFRPLAGTDGGMGGRTVTTLQTGPLAALNTWARTSHEWEMSARLLQKTKPQRYLQRETYKAGWARTFMEAEKAPGSAVSKLGPQES